MKKISVVVVVALLLIIMVVYAAGKRSQPVDVSKLAVVVSFYPLYFFTQAIAGTLVDVTNVTPAGAEPHDYDPSTGDIARMEQSKLVILNGGHLEAWGDKIKENLKGSPTSVITVGDGLATRQLSENGKTNLDPHVWLDPVLAKKEVAAITAGLSAVDSVHQADFAQGEQRLLGKLDALDASYRQGLKACTSKDIVTSHEAFGYLGAEYGFNQVAIAGLSPDSEPSIQQLGEVSNFVKQHGVRYIFFESLVSPKLSNTIATETSARTLELNPLEGLTAQQVQRGDDYFTVMQRNLTNLRLALSCS